MADTPDLDELARRYLDLWQEHLCDLSADGEIAQTVAKSIELMNGSAAAFAKMAETSLQQSGDNNHDAGHRANTDHPTGTSPAGPASDNSDAILDQLTRRIGELEKRIADLESAPEGKGG